MPFFLPLGSYSCSHLNRFRLRAVGRGELLHVGRVDIRCLIERDQFIVDVLQFHDHQTALVQDASDGISIVVHRRQRLGGHGREGDERSNELVHRVHGHCPVTLQDLAGLRRP